MSYKNELKSNNAELQEILDSVNALPDAEGGTAVEDLDAVLTEQESLIDELKAILDTKASGGGGDDIASAIVDRSVTEFASNTATKIGDYAFRNCTKLKSVNAPNAASIGEYAFQGCSLLESVNLPLAASIGQYAFNQCNKLMEIVLPSLTSAATNSFRDCQYVETIDLPKVTAISSQAFYGCRGLKALILRSNTIVTLSSTNAFTTCYRILGTKNAGFNPNGEKIGFIYVPKALLSDTDETMDYRRATNWSDSSLVTQFRAIEDYPEITGG